MREALGALDARVSLVRCLRTPGGPVNSVWGASATKGSDSSRASSLVAFFDPIMVPPAISYRWSVPPYVLLKLVTFSVTP